MKTGIKRRTNRPEAASRRRKRAKVEATAPKPSEESVKTRIMIRPGTGLGPEGSSLFPRRLSSRSPRTSHLYPQQSLQPIASSIAPLRGLPSFGPTIRIHPQKKRLSLVTRVALAVAVGAGAYTFYGLSHEAHRSVVPVVVSGTALIRQTPSGAHERWGNTSVTVTLDASLDALDPAAKDAVRSAFGTWVASGIVLPRLMFESSDKSRGAVQDGVNLVRYGPITLPGHEQDLAVTIGYEDATTGEILEADTIFNSDYPIAALPGQSSEKAEEDSSRGCDDRYDLQNVATHEAGHFFGLGEDAEDTRATMYFRSLPCQTHKRVLTDPDRAIMTTLYAEPLPGAAQGCGGTAAPTPSSTRSTPSSAR